MLPLRLRVYVSIFICVLLGGTFGLMVVENLPAFDAFYFVIVTIATVGYGDIHPLTQAGKLLVILIIVTGVGCFIGVAANSIEYVIDQRERKIRMEKLNMIIGIFFSEAGTSLLKRLSAADPAAGEIRSALIVSGTWTEADFFHARAVIMNHNSVPDNSLSLPELHAFLMEHKGFMLALLENPQLIEHDSFTPLLQALFHLTEELMSRERLLDLPLADQSHLAGDINRVYHLLLIEWITYMHALSRRYPYLFSLAMRRNPFDRNASVIVS